MWHRFLILVAIIGVLGASYFMWALHRINPATFIPEGRAWPRPFPYPDNWLLALNNYYDRRYPPLRREIKTRSEIYRVQQTVMLAVGFFGVMAAVGIVPLASWWNRFRRSSRRGFPVVPVDRTTKDDGSG